MCLFTFFILIIGANRPEQIRCRILMLNKMLKHQIIIVVIMISIIIISLSNSFKENWIHYIDLPSFFTRKITFITSCFCPVHQSPSEKGSALKGKNFLPTGDDPFSEGRLKQFWQLPTLKVRGINHLYQAYSSNCSLSLREKCRTAWQNWHFLILSLKNLVFLTNVLWILAKKIIFWQQICLQSCRYLSVLQKITVSLQCLH